MFDGFESILGGVVDLSKKFFDTTVYLDPIGNVASID